MSDKKQITPVSVTATPPFTLLFLTFLVLKLCGVITWSWWWIFAPLWIPIAVGCCALMLIVLIVIAREIFSRQ